MKILLIILSLFAFLSHAGVSQESRSSLYHSIRSHEDHPVLKKVVFQVFGEILIRKARELSQEKPQEAILHYIEAWRIYESEYAKRVLEAIKSSSKGLLAFNEVLSEFEENNKRSFLQSELSGRILSLSARLTDKAREERAKKNYKMVTIYIKEAEALDPSPRSPVQAFKKQAFTTGKMRETFEGIKNNEKLHLSLGVEKAEAQEFFERHLLSLVLNELSFMWYSFHFIDKPEEAIFISRVFKEIESEKALEISKQKQKNILDCVKSVSNKKTGKDKS